ncbi:RES family NAD+ phosphorylase [Akkermansiaceae bacterium]|nr:RES family NAD+ phosphorylase [Akkermansiaceae bacterium]
MKITAYRITKTKYASDAFSGEGARLTGGRWNPIGSRMVYLASSLSLATLELFVHTEDHAMLMRLFSYLPITFDSKLIETPKPKDLPKGWDSPEIMASTQIYGGDWLRSKRSAVLAVPSAVTQSEVNYLLNPEHPDFSKIKIGKAVPFQLDPRLV